jgi:hypothetical protein
MRSGAPYSAAFDTNLSLALVLQIPKLRCEQKLKWFTHSFVRPPVLDVRLYQDDDGPLALVSGQ